MRPSRWLPLVAVALLAACSSTSAAVDVVATVAPGTATSTPTTPPSTSGPGSNTGGSTTAGALPSTSATPTASLDWQPCGSSQRNLQCATLTVPLDYSDPSKGTIDLALKKRPAGNPSERVGSLLVNPGGPGVPGTELVDEAAQAFSTNLRQHFDIVGWDPRGTGASSAVSCGEKLDPYLDLDPSPDTPSEKQALIDAAKKFAAMCEADSGRILPFISTQDSARDIDEIRKALGEDKISYFGFSYGSELGAVYATMFPGSVRAMVVDGAVDPNSSYEDEARRQAVGLETELDKFLAQCAADTSCPFHSGGNPQAAFDKLLADLDLHPLLLGDREVGQAIAYTGIVSALYNSDAWPTLAQALADARNGDGRLLAAMNDAYTERSPDGTYSHLFESLIAINCLDDPGPTDLGFPDRLAAELAPVAPRLGATEAYSYICDFWPVKQKPPIKVTGAGAGPIVVVGTTGDPITPLESTKRLAAELQQGVLVTVQADQHTGYNANQCVVNAVDDYLVNLTVPATGLFCS